MIRELCSLGQKEPHLTRQGFSRESAGLTCLVMRGVLLVASEHTLDEHVGTHFDILEAHVGAVEEGGQGTLQVYCQKCPPWGGV